MYLFVCMNWELTLYCNYDSCLFSKDRTRQAVSV